MYGHQSTLTAIAGGLLIVLGAVQALGGGFTIPGLNRITPRLGGDSPPAVLALGAVSGLTGFCAGPILGAVLTIAATSGAALDGGALLAVHAAGMTAPLFLLALLWDRYDLGRRRWLRGRLEPLTVEVLDRGHPAGIGVGPQVAPLDELVQRLRELLVALPVQLGGPRPRDADAR